MNFTLKVNQQIKSMYLVYILMQSNFDNNNNYQQIIFIFYLPILMYNLYSLVFKVIAEFYFFSLIIMLFIIYKELLNKTEVHQILLN
jgi:hypothetical protein